MLTMEKLTELGVDPAEGLKRCMNKEEFYFKMLKMSLSNAYFDSLGQLIDAGDLAEAFEQAHALKGVLGNIAIAPLYEPMAEMTEMLRAKKEADYATMYRPIKELRDKLLANI